MNTNDLITKISNLNGVVSAALWEKSENPRIYVNFYSQNNMPALTIGKGRNAKAGKFYIELTTDKAVIVKQFLDFSGATTREKVLPAIAKIESIVAEFNAPASLKKTAKTVMIRAWAIARAAVAKFGGNVKEFFSASLKLAWAE